MNISKNDNFNQKKETPIISAENEAALELLGTIYDLHDAQRWIRRFIEKNRFKEYDELIFHLGESVFILDKLIRNYSNSMDELMKEKTEHYRKLRENYNQN